MTPNPTMTLDDGQAKALRDSELRYRRLFETAQDGILILSFDTGRITDANPYLLRLLGFSLEEILDKTVGELSPFKDIEANTVMLRRLKEEGFVRYKDLPLQSRDGKPHFVEFVSNVYLAGEDKVIQCNIRDITAAKRAESRFKRLVDSDVQGVMFWNLEGLVTNANRAFLELIQYSQEDLDAGRVNWTALTPPEFAPLDRQALRQIGEHGVCAPYEKDLIRKDGTRVCILIGATTFEDTPTEGVAFVLDLTDRNRLQHQFLRAQRLESIGTLAGGIAHDLNNILAPIMMSIEMLQTRTTDPESQVLLNLILASSKRGADIVRQVLSFARGVKGERIPVQPRLVLRDIETVITTTFPKAIHLKMAFRQQPWSVLGDPTQFHQLLLNLCVNARDAMPHGGQLTITCENAVLDAQSAVMQINATEGPHVIITITDTGVGIPQTIIDKIFDPFFTTKPLGEAAGLGLSTVIAIVKSHGGFINVCSEPGKGTTFRVGLPTHETGVEPIADPPTRSQLPRGNGEMILLVDDEETILTVTGRTLEDFGYRTVLAHDGAEAVAIYATHRREISAVLTDIAMPIMDGYATIRALLIINPALKIIAASGFNVGTGTDKLPPEIGKHVLSKPYTAATLLEAVHSVLADSPAGPIAHLGFTGRSQGPESRP